MVRTARVQAMAQVFGDLSYAGIRAAAQDATA